MPAEQSRRARAGRGDGGFRNGKEFVTAAEYSSAHGTPSARSIAVPATDRSPAADAFDRGAGSQAEDAATLAVRGRAVGTSQMPTPSGSRYPSASSRRPSRISVSSRLPMTAFQSG